MRRPRRRMPSRVGRPPHLRVRVERPSAALLLIRNIGAYARDGPPHNPLGDNGQNALHEPVRAQLHVGSGGVVRLLASPGTLEIRIERREPDAHRVLLVLLLSAHDYGACNGNHLRPLRKRRFAPALHASFLRHTGRQRDSGSHGFHERASPGGLHLRLCRRGLGVELHLRFWLQGYRRLDSASRAGVLRHDSPGLACPASR